MFAAFVIVLFESLSCPQCEKMDLKIIQSVTDSVTPSIRPSTPDLPTHSQ